MIPKPKLKCAPLKKRGFKGKWNPKEHCDIHNPMPQKMWPFKFNQPVYFIDSRFNTIECGLVSWYHPARERDHGCIITPGHPFYRVVTKHGIKKEVIQCAGLKIPTMKKFENAETASDVFPYTDKGFKTALLTVARYVEDKAATCRLEAERALNRAADYLENAKAIRKQALKK